jgi:hypothetical protein
MRGVDILSSVSRMSRAVELMLSVGGADSGRVPAPNTFTNNTYIQKKQLKVMLRPVLWIRIRIVSRFNGVPGSVSGSNREKMAQINRKQLINFS